MIIRRITGEVTSGKVKVDIRHNVNTDYETRESQLIDIGGKGALANFKLATGRRTDSLEEHSIKTLVENQLASKRRILAQQLASNYSFLSSQ